MPTMAHDGSSITVGIDTHGQVHVAAALDERGRLVGTASFPTTRRGHRELERWATRLGPVAAFGIEGTGAWGAGIARHLGAQGFPVVEVDRPDRRARRRRGKSDMIDAEAAARAVQAGVATGVPKSRSAQVEAVRALRVARRSAVKARTQAALQLQSLVSTGPAALRDELSAARLEELVERCARFRPAACADPGNATKLALRSIARRWRALSDEIDDLDAVIRPLVAQAAPRLLELNGVGAQVAAQLLVTAGDNPDRLRSEAAFAHLCGVAPIPASSGRTARHRLNRGGDRQANSALHRIVICRLRWDVRTRSYVERRTKQGLSKPEIMRCLKRYVAREVYAELKRLVDDR